VIVQDKIFIVDENETNIEILREYLEENYMLEVAHSGEEALRKAPGFQPALILLDITMPGIEGYEVCRQIRATPALRHVKIIIISARTMLSERLEGYAAGADDYITKPFDEEELLAKVQVYLRLQYAEEMDQLKSDLLTLLSHETRTPLTTIISPVEILLASDDVEPEQRRLLLNMVDQSAKKLQRLFEKVLMLSELKSRKAHFQWQQGDLKEPVNEVIKNLATLITERDVHITQRFSNSVRTTFDHEKIQFVIHAILENALHYSPSGKSIEVNVFSDAGQHCIAVTNHGESIDPVFLGQIFDEFSNRDVDHHSQGHGLSLAIARHIIKMHKGVIDVVSSPDGGTTFTVRLP
jgi:signal transduction histidine kinase